MAGMSSSSGRGKTWTERSKAPRQDERLIHEFALFATRIALLTSEIRSCKPLIGFNYPLVKN